MRFKLRRLILITVLGYAVICIVLAISLGELAFRPQRLPVRGEAQAQAAVAPFGGVLQDVSMVASDDTRLRGWFDRPAKPNGDAVILLHGVGDNREGMMGFAELFLSHGYAVLVPDSRAHGASGGSFPTYGAKEVRDVHEWYRWLEDNDRPHCVFGMGESMGAAIVLQAVRAVPFCAVVAESAFASFRQIAYVRVGQIFHTGSWLGSTVLRPAVELAFLYGRLTRGVNLAKVSPEEAVVGARIPILLIHGLADTNIPPHQSEIIRSQNQSDIVFWEVPNAGHCGAVNAAPEEFDRRVLGWFADRTVTPKEFRRSVEVPVDPGR